MPRGSIVLSFLIFLLPGVALSFQDARSLSSTHHRRSAATLSIAGRVVREDGRPPRELIQVNLVCSGRLREQTATSPDGSFTFEIGAARNEDWLDPSMGGSANGALESTVKVASPGSSPNLDEVPSMGLGRVSLNGCEIRLSPRPGYSSNSIALSTRSSGDNPDIGVIILRRESTGGSATVSLSVLTAPRKARKAFETATRELASEAPDLAEIRENLEEALEEYPEFSAAWDLMARVEMTEGRIGEARNAFVRAIEAEPEYLAPHLGLGQIAAREGDWSEAAKWTGRALAIDSLVPEGLYWHGLSHFYLNDFPTCEASLSSLYELSLIHI